MILAGDIGGTKTRIALYQRVPGGIAREVEETYPSARHESLEAILREFRARHREPVEAAGFGVAGPIRDGRSKVTNLPWTISAPELAHELGLARVELVNDLVATAWGIALVPPERRVVLQQGEADPTGNQAVVAAGTGLGQAGLCFDGREHVAFGSEDGHADWAPANELEDELLHFLRRELGKVGNERVLSGPGLVNAYRFLRDTGRGHEDPELARAIAAGDPAAAISRAALERGDELASRALDLFVSIYGARAGNFALSILATGGVWIGGGIAPKILPRLRSGGFVDAFRSKSKLGELLARVPVTVILDDRAALHGAARCATRHAG